MAAEMACFGTAGSDVFNTDAAQFSCFLGPGQLAQTQNDSLSRLPNYMNCNSKSKIKNGFWDIFLLIKGIRIKLRYYGEICMWGTFPRDDLFVPII